MSCSSCHLRRFWGARGAVPITRSQFRRCLSATTIVTETSPRNSDPHGITFVDCTSSIQLAADRRTYLSSRVIFVSTTPPTGAGVRSACSSPVISHDLHDSINTLCILHVRRSLLHILQASLL